jgi:muramoyltetrapeptide carboxypeptidase
LRGESDVADAERLHDLQWALDDPAIDAVWCVRGGYGMTRIVDRVSFAAFAERPKPVIGYSDVTALHAAVAAQVGVVTFHAHTARAALPAMSAASLRAALTQQGQPCGDEARPVRAGRVSGRLAGGNLSLLASLCGTPNALRPDGAIIILEDLHEAAYRVDRMLRQLEQSGALRGIVGLAVGQFTMVPADENPDALTIDALIAELADRLQVPCLANLPIGHIADQWTVPLGAQATLDVEGRSLHVAAPEVSFNVS